jgi:uncharacterized protein (TIGR03067 family)
MLCRSTILLLIVCVSTSSAEDKGNPKAEPDRKAIEGEWRVTYIEVDGWAGPVEKLKGASYTFADGKLSLMNEGKVSAQGTYQLDPSKAPKHIDMIKGEQNTAGIYELEGNKLTICAASVVGNKERPKKFKTSNGSRTMLMKLERVKK